MARVSRCRAPLFAKDPRSLRAGRASAAGVSGRASRPEADAYRSCKARAARCARILGRAPGRGAHQPLADARARRRAVVRPLSRAPRQARDRRALRRALAKTPEDPAKPLTVSAAKRIVETELRAGEDREPWILARDAAVLALLYGSGLRISEALGLERNAVPEPGRGDAILVTGKGNKTRMVPVLQQVLRLVADYVAICPYALAADGPLFVGARGGPLSPRVVQLAVAPPPGALR